MLAGAQGASGGGKAWSARWEPGLYCFNEHGSELAAAPVPAAELVALAAWLPLAQHSGLVRRSGASSVTLACLA